MEAKDHDRSKKIVNAVQIKIFAEDLFKDRIAVTNEQELSDTIHNESSLDQYKVYMESFCVSKATTLDTLKK